MKTIFKRQLAFSALSLLLLSSCKGLSIETKEGKERVMSHFVSLLSGEESQFVSDEVVELSDVERAKGLVWEQWLAANNSFDEQKLIELTPLSDGKSSSWNLPQDLEKDAVMPYYFGFKGEKPESGYPLFLYIHGSGPKEKEWSTGLKLGNKFEDGPSVYFIPQIPNESSYRWYQRSKQYAWEKLLRFALMRQDFDPNRVYLFGISEGGYGSQRLASYYADYLAGAGPMAAGEPLRNAPVENCSNISFSLLTGAEDLGFGRNELTQITKDEFQKFQEANPGEFDHRIELIPEKGHSIDYSPTTVWLKDKVRNPHPTHFIWENFEMDGVYRDGFYNLYVNQRSNVDDKSRTRYTFSAKDNTITLDVDLVSYEVTARNKWGVETLYNKTYTPATSGELTIYLNDKIVDMGREVTVVVNGKQAYKGVVTPTLEVMINSCAAYYDPERVYCGEVKVAVK